MRKISSCCFDCLLKKELNQYPENSDEEKIIEYKKAVLSSLAAVTDKTSAPEIVRYADIARRRIFKAEPFDYSELKKIYNRLMLDYEKTIEEKIESSADPLSKALKYAMIGNYIDFGALGNVDDEKLDQLLSDTGKYSAGEDYPSFEAELSRAKRLAYLTDNCGEIVLDKLFIKQIQKAYPQIEISVIVRGKPTLNDATLEDAIFCGIDKIAKVIPNGSDLAGTKLDEISAEASNAIRNANLIISKGQANYETMCDSGMNIFFVFIIKCRHFSETFGKGMFEGKLLHLSPDKGKNIG